MSSADHDGCVQRRSPASLLNRMAEAASPKCAVRGIAAAVAAAASPGRASKLGVDDGEGSLQSAQEPTDEFAINLSPPPPLGGGGPPQWLRSFALPFALLCGALAGIVPLCAIACLGFFDDGESPAPAPAGPTQPPQPQLGWGQQWGGWLVSSQPPSQLVPTAGDAAAVGAPDAHLLGAVESLRHELRRQEASQKAVEASVSTRMQRLESSVASSVSSAAVAAAAGASSLLGGALGRRSTQELSSVLDGLGVDWLAWSAGAEIDAGYTSSGVGRGILGRAARAVAAAVPRYRTHLGNVSHPPEVVLAADAAPPTRCFTFRGSGTIAVRLRADALLTHVAVEHVPAWAALKPHAVPRRFDVRARAAGSPAGSAYGPALGSFEYAFDGPRVQVFSLGDTGVLADAVQFTFTENWGEDFTAVCRVRALGPARATSPAA